MVRFAVSALLVLCSASLPAAEVVFCYEDKSLPPMFTGEGLDVPVKDPGASIEILQQLSLTAPTVQFSFVRRPWKRCLADLKMNKVDAVIATYREERDSYMTFPKLANGSVNHNSAISQFGSCLVGLADKLALKAQPKDISVAVPSGYSVAFKLRDAGYRVVSTYSQDEAYDLVLKGVVDATIGICELGKDKVKGFLHADSLSARYPPFDINYGFVAFSKGYTQDHAETVELVWHTLQQVPSTPLYLKYIMRGLEE